MRPVLPGSLTNRARRAKIAAAKPTHEAPMPRTRFEDDPRDAPFPDRAPGSGNGPLIGLIVIVLLVILAGGGGLAMYTVRRGAAQRQEAAAMRAQAQATRAKAVVGVGGPATVPIIDGGTGEGIANDFRADAARAGQK